MNRADTPPLPRPRTRPPEHLTMLPTSHSRRISAAARAQAPAFEPLPEDVTRSSLIDPHDETLETEITEEMISLALEAIESEQVWPYASDRTVVAQPVRTAQIIRFPGC